MAGKKRKPTARKPVSSSSSNTGRSGPMAVSPAEAAAIAARRDPRRFIYGGLDVVLALVFFFVIGDVIPPRMLWVEILLGSMVVLIAVMALGMLLPTPGSDQIRRIRWTVVVGSGVALLLVVVAVLGLIVMSAAYLSGVYGAFGKAAASGAIVAALLTIEGVALVPALQLKYLMTRAGRRAFGLPPLWPRPARRSVDEIIAAAGATR